MRFQYSILSICILIVVLSSCATSQFGWESEPSHEKKTSKDEHKYKEDFDPLLLKENEIVVEPTESRIQPQNDMLALNTAETPEAVQTETRGVPGYCVQLFATEDEARAREFKKNAMLKLASDVYWVFESGMYKIRTGNCQTRKEAEISLQNIRQKGSEFRDAWIVKTRIQLEVEISE